MHALHHRSDGSINIDFYRGKALRERRAYLGTILPDVSLPNLTPEGRRRLKLFIAAFAVAAGAFWATILTTPPKTEAAQPGVSINIYELTVGTNAPLSEPVDAF